MLVPQNALRILCERTGGSISRATFYRWVNSGKVSSIRLGSRIFIPWLALEQLIHRCLEGE
jgi:predicted DNA-binding transcriptional regulator AlpA